jgi:hypothetical protein
LWTPERSASPGPAPPRLPAPPPLVPALPLYKDAADAAPGGCGTGLSKLRAEGSDMDPSAPTTVTVSCDPGVDFSCKLMLDLSAMLGDGICGRLVAVDDVGGDCSCVYGWAGVSVCGCLQPPTVLSAEDCACTAAAAAAGGGAAAGGAGTGTNRRAEPAPTPACCCAAAIMPVADAAAGLTADIPFVEVEARTAGSRADASPQVCETLFRRRDGPAAPEETDEGCT